MKQVSGLAAAVALSIGLISAPVPAQEAGPPKQSGEQVMRNAMERVTEGSSLSLDELSQLAEAIKGMRELPANGMRVLEVGDGQMAVGSLNGRFMVVGQIYDSWNDQMLDSLDAVDRYAHRADLEQIGLDVDQLATLTMTSGIQPDEGESWRETVLFADPGHDGSRSMINQAREYLGSVDRAEAVKVVLVPFLRGSDEIARRSMCIAERKGGGAALNALMQQTAGDIEPQNDECGIEAVLKSYASAQALGVTSAPYWILPEGRMHKGKLDLASELQAKES